MGGRWVMLMLLVGAGTMGGVEAGIESDFKCVAACIDVLGEGYAKCLGCIDRFVAGASQVAPSYAKDMLAFKLSPTDYTKGFCGRHTVPTEGVDMERYPGGWMPTGNGTYTGCERTTDYPGVGTTSYQSHAYVKEELRKVPRRQEAGEIWRGNELGLIISNALFWPKVSPRSLLLGSNVRQHKVVRPILDELYGKCDLECEGRLMESARAFMGRERVEVQGDIKKWVFEELFRTTYPGEANPIDAADFVETQGKFLTLQPLVQIVPQFLSELMAKGTTEKLGEYFDKLRPLTEKHYGARVRDGDCSPTKGGCVDQLTSAILDTLVAAGGLSVPGGISTALWVLHTDTARYGETFPAGGVRLDNANPLPFYYESLRFFAPVVGFPYWKPFPERAFDDHASQYKGGVREVLNVALANKDPNAWGAEAHKFRVREMAEYHEKFIGFADFAVDATVAGGAMNRACPGKTMALAMGKAFFTYWEQDAWELEAGAEAPEYKEVAPFVSDFVLTRKASSRTATFWERVMGGLEELAGKVVDEFRFDTYTRGMAVANAEAVRTWPMPGARDVPPPSEHREVAKVPCGLAYEITVPKDDEGWEEVEDLYAYAQSQFARLSTFPDTAAECGEWKEGEDRAATVKALQYGGLNEKRVLVPWGQEHKYTDAGFSDLVFKGIGQHRVERVRAGDAYAEGATYAVYLGFAEVLETKPGFARYGADAYFDAAGRVTHLRRLGRTYRPGDEGWAAHESTTMTEAECAAKAGAWSCKVGIDFWNGRTCRCAVPQRSGWREAKTAFLGTFGAVVSAVDHLYGLHLVVANSIVTANVEELPPTHPLRRLMSPFGFRTATINWQAAFALTNEFGLLHRAMPLTVTGFRQLYTYARLEQAGLTWKTIPERHAAQRVELPSFPLHEDGGDFYRVVKTFVHRYLSRHFDYASNGCRADEGVRRWHARVNSLSPNRDLPPVEAITCEHLEDLLSTFIYYVTAGHTHVGSIGAEFEDPCHLPWAWREGENCATPRTAYTQMLVLALTSLEQPKLLGDYTHIFSDPADAADWNAFQADLRAFGDRVDQRNALRERPFKSFDLRYVEISVGI